MNVPPVIPTKPAGAATAPGASVGAGDEDFAAMIPTVHDDGRASETADGSSSESPSDPAVATMEQHADQVDQTMDQPAASVIQSLIAESKPQPKESLLPGAELQRIGDIEAALTTAKPPQAATGDRPVSVAPASDPVPAIPPAPTTPKIGATGELATPEPPLGAGRGPISLAGVLTDFTNPSQGQPAQQASGETAAAIPASGESVGASQPPGSTAVGADGMPLTGQPAVPPVAPSVPPMTQQAAVPTNTGIDAPGREPRIAQAGQGGKGKPNAATGPTPGASAAPTQGPSGLIAGFTAATTTNPELAASNVNLDGAAQVAGTPFDGAAAKAPPMISGAGANPAAAQSGMINDTAAAFGGDLRLGADGVRPAALDQAFRGLAPQPASEQIAVRISHAVQQGADRITVNLKPASLGHISIDLEIGPDNRLIAVIAADRPETLDLMQRDARTLERLLNDAGLKTDSGSLSFNLRGDGGGGHGDSDPGGETGDWSSYAAPDTTANATPMPVYARTLGADGGIDIRV